MSERGGTATIKFDKGYDAPWLVFEGDPVILFNRLQSAFEYSDEEIAGYTLADLIVKASTDAQRKYKSGPRPPKSGTQVQKDAEEALESIGAEKVAESEVTPETSGSDNDWLIAEIATAESEAQLLELYSSNDAVFQADEKAVTAFRARYAQVAA